MKRRNFSYLRGRAAQNSAKFIARPTDDTFKVQPEAEKPEVKVVVDPSIKPDDTEAEEE